jgi:hypothetical protein
MIEETPDAIKELARDMLHDQTIAHSFELGTDADGKTLYMVLMIVDRQMLDRHPILGTDAAANRARVSQTDDSGQPPEAL